MSKDRDKFARDGGNVNVAFVEDVVEREVKGALIPVDDEPAEKGALIPIDDEPTEKGKLIPIDDEPKKQGVLIPIDDEPKKMAASAPKKGSAAEGKPAGAESLYTVEVVSAEIIPEEESSGGALSADDAKGKQTQNIANKTQKPASKTQKDRQRAEKKAALKKLKALKKQIKNGELSFVPPENNQEELSFYGERLPYPGGFPVYCCKYVIITDGTRKLAMRFFNASDILVTGLRFTLIEKDANGDVLEVRKQERTGLFAERGTEFAVADAEVARGCVSVEIRVEMVKSDMYEYVIDDAGNVELRYGESDPTAEFYFKNKRSYSVKKRRRWYVTFAVLAVVCITAIAVGVSVKLGILDKVQTNAVETGAAIIYQISGGDLYVEA